MLAFNIYFQSVTKGTRLIKLKYHQRWLTKDFLLYASENNQYLGELSKTIGGTIMERCNYFREIHVVHFTIKFPNILHLKIDCALLVTRKT